jgi:pimeloyl-ACP methyl ester carboxylesterase
VTKRLAIAMLVAAVGIACERAAAPATNAPVEAGYDALPSFNGFHGFDPKPVLESLNVPGLWLLAGEDRSIPTPATVAILDQLIASGKPYTHVVFPGAGHNLPPNWPEIDKWLAKTLK